ncbi:hypothetical protein GCM10023259_071990 [Thermocatellispora tengchongensis]
METARRPTATGDRSPETAPTAGDGGGHRLAGTTPPSPTPHHPATGPEDLIHGGLTAQPDGDLRNPRGQVCTSDTTTPERAQGQDRGRDRGRSQDRDRDRGHSQGQGQGQGQSRDRGRSQGQDRDRGRDRGRGRGHSQSHGQGQGQSRGRGRSQGRGRGRGARSGLAAVARGGVAGVVGGGMVAVGQVLVALVVTRGFTAQVAGAFFAAIALCQIAAGVLRLDAGNGLVYFIARSRAYDHHGMSGYIRAGVVPVLVLSLAAAVSACLFAEPIGAATGVPPAWIGPLALVLPLIACSDVLLSATRGFGDMRPTVYVSGLFLPAAQLAGICAMAVAGAEAGLTAAWALPYLPVLALAWVCLKRRLPESAYRPGYMPGTFRDLWRHTAPRSAGAAIQAAFQRLDIVLVAALAGPVEAACYTVATRFKAVGQLAGQGLAQAAQPRLVRALAAGELERARELYQSTTLWLVAATWPVWVAYAALAPWLLRIFGPGYDAGAGVAVVLAATMMAASACGMADVVLTAAGHTTTSLRNIAAAVVVAVTVDVALIPEYGALGAAAGWSAGVLVKNVLPLVRLHRTYGLRPFGRHTLTALHPRMWRTA